jgi:hypothetical protein
MVFDRWGGDCSGFTPTCNLASADHNVTATFGVDSDGDGIPDSRDCAPNDPNPNPGWFPPGTCYAPVSIYSVASDTVAAGTKVYLTEVMITAIAPNGHDIWVGVQSSENPYNGPTFSGLEIDTSALSSPPALAVGDRVTVGGTVASSLLLDQVVHLELTATGGTPAPASISAPYDSQWAGLRNVLVTISSQTVNSTVNGEYNLASGLIVGKSIIGTLPSIADASPVSSITGIASIRTGPVDVISPRSNTDIVT